MEQKQQGFTDANGQGILNIQFLVDIKQYVQQIYLTQQYCYLINILILCYGQEHKLHTTITGLDFHALGLGKNSGSVYNFYIGFSKPKLCQKTNAEVTNTNGFNCFLIQWL